MKTSLPLDIVSGAVLFWLLLLAATAMAGPIVQPDLTAESTPAASRRSNVIQLAQQASGQDDPKTQSAPPKARQTDPSAEDKATTSEPEGSKRTLKPFTPSEEIKVDQSVDFPYDI
jgi:hypothetical protein